MGAKVDVGRLGSCVGMRTIVAEGVMEGVRVGVAVTVGVKVMVGVEDGNGVSVGGNKTSSKGIPPPAEQACSKSPSTIIR